MNNIAIIYTTFLRNELAFETIQSIQPCLNENIQLFIGDQNKEDNYINQNPNWHYTNYYKLPYDCGLSYSRNRLIDLADFMDYKYILLTADSIEFIDCYDFDPYIEFLKSNPKHALVGFQLNNRVPWEFNLRYVPGDSFYLEASNEVVKFKNLEFKKIDICKNFFLAKTSILNKIEWDRELKLQEHSDMFFRLKQARYNCFYNSDIKANYIDFKPPEYNVMRDRMNKEYKDLFMAKYNIKEWVKYSPEARKIFFEFNQKRRLGGGRK